MTASSGSARKIKLAIFATHPIQYQVPWFQALTLESGLDVHVYYAMLPDASQQGIDFGTAFTWDLPLLEGYEWTLLENHSRNPSLQTFRGCHVTGMKRALQISPPDVALITGWNSMYLLQALWVCKRLRIPVLARGESNTLKPRGDLRNWLLQRFVHQFDGFLAIGKSNEAFYREAGIAGDRMFPCRYFVDNERFEQQAAALRLDRLKWRKRWGVPAHSVCFVFVGKLIPKKRVFDFLEAIDTAHRRGVPVHGLVVGTGEQMPETCSFVDDRQLPVTFAGFLNQSEITTAYVAADCLVLPSDHGETWGLVVNEAMACGIPAVVSDQVGCGPDLVEEGKTGAVFSMGNTGALADALARLSRTPDRLKAMGKTARDLVSARYSVSRAVSGTTAAASGILARQASE